MIQNIQKNKLNGLWGNLGKKDPKWATRDQAIKLLDKFGELGNSVVDKIKKDKKSGKLKAKN